VYAACANDGLLVMVTNPVPELLEQRDLGGSVVELFEKNGELCARVLKSTTAIVVASPPPTPAQVTLEQEEERGARPPQTPAKPRKRKRKRHLDGWGHVIERDDDTVIVDLGSDDGVEVGERVEFVLADPLEEQRSPLSVVGIVRAVAPRRARVLLGQNEDVPLYSPGRVSARPVTKSSTAPPRAHDFTSVSLLLRPFLGIASTGGGIIVDAAVSRRLSAPVRLSAVIAPFGYGAEGGLSATTFTGYVMPSYDTRLFEAGVGLGVQTVNTSYFEPGTGTLLPLFVRLGASDGLSLSGRADFTLFHQSLAANGARVELLFPVERGAWLLLNGAGGRSGYTELELGLRAQMYGNGGRGSHFITVVAGASEVSSQLCVRAFESSWCMDNPRVSGAHFGVGFESRL
jgi:hypothetical protein